VGAAAHQFAKVVGRLAKQSSHSQIMRPLEPLRGRKVLVDVYASKIQERSGVEIGVFRFGLYPSKPLHIMELAKVTLW
jgi:hypothetical protein